MDSFSPVHWFIVLLPVIVLQAVPVAQILRRAGLSGWWTVAYFVPLFGWVSLWIFAYARWPATSLTPAAASGTGQGGAA